MLPVNRPEVRLYCHNPSCLHEDESWHFGCRGDDDVHYFCPVCKGPAYPIKLEKEERKMFKKKEGTHQVQQREFIVVDFERKSMKVIPESRIREEGDDIDLLIPMLSLVELQEMRTTNKRGRREFEQNIETLCRGINEGELPYTPAILGWLERMGYLKEDDEGEGRKEEDNEEDVNKMIPVGYGKFDNGPYLNGFTAGLIFSQSPEFKELLAESLNEMNKERPVAVNETIAEEKKKKMVSMLARVRAKLPNR